jgi:hypothetical protein
MVTGNLDLNVMLKVELYDIKTAYRLIKDNKGF